MNFSQSFTAAANAAARVSGGPLAFSLACLAIVVWCVTGPLYHFSDAWQLIINTVTNLVTFLMVFLIQNTQNRDSAAIQAKLDELIRSTAGHRELIGIEELTEEEISAIKSRRAKRG